MVKNELRQIITEVSPDAIFFETPSFDNSIIGMSTSGEVVYDYYKMIKEFIEDGLVNGIDDISEEDAIDFIEYNTIGSLSFASSFGVAPVVINTLYSTDNFNL